MVHITDWLPTLVTAAGGNLQDYPELQDIDGKDQVSMGVPCFLYFPYVILFSLSTMLSFEVAGVSGTPLCITF